MRPEHWVYTIPLRLRSLFRWAQANQELAIYRDLFPRCSSIGNGNKNAAINYNRNHRNVACN